MRVPKFVDHCITCLREPPFEDGLGLTDEHVIPASLGGILRSDLLCKKCNSGFGSGFEGKAKADPAIRIAIRHLRAQLPELYDSMENGQPYRIKTALGEHPGKYERGEVLGRTLKLPDSILASEQDTPRILRGMMEKAGYNEKFIGDAFRRYDEAPEEQRFEIFPGQAIMKRVAENAGPQLAGAPQLDSLVALKIAYEFAVLIVGRPMLAARAQLDKIRTALVEGPVGADVFDVEPLMAKEYAPFHGIMFEGNNPYATVRVVLFGKLAYRVHLKKLALDIKPVAYTHLLRTGEDWWNWVPQAEEPILASEETA